MSILPDYVRYTGATEAQVQWGGNDDPRDLLTIDQVYRVEKIEVHTWHTKIMLVDFPGKQFNSVCFEPEKQP